MALVNWSSFSLSSRRSIGSWYNQGTITFSSVGRLWLVAFGRQDYRSRSVGLVAKTIVLPVALVALSKTIVSV